VGDDANKLEADVLVTLKESMKLGREVPQCLIGLQYIARRIPHVFHREEEEEKNGRRR
jgi:hypothetical protein